MIEFTLQNAYLVAILPFISVFLLGFVTRKNADLSAGISIVSILISFFLSCLILYGKIMNYDVDTHGEYRWLTTGDFNLTVGWNVDNITAIMLVVVTFVSSAIQIYSLYMYGYQMQWKVLHLLAH